MRRFEPQVTASYVILLAWFLGCAGLYHLFFKYDWDAGVQRAGLVTAIGAWILLPLLLRGRLVLRLGSWRAPGLALLALAFVGIGYHLYIANRTMEFSKARRQIWLDQGQMSYGAVRYLMRGEDPYGPGAMLDPMGYAYQIAAYQFDTECTRYSGYQMKARMDQAWNTYRFDPLVTRTLFPMIAESPACQEIREAFGRLGYKYGPLLIYSYIPLVLALDHPGVYATHIILFLLLCAMVGLHGWRISGGSFALTALGLSIILIPAHIRHNALQFSAGDLLPSLLVVGFLILLSRKRTSWAAVSLGLSIGSKIAPGIALLPLLLIAPKRQIPIALGVLAALFAPFVIWHSTGLWENVFVTIFLTRETDSTALFHFISQGMARIVQLALLVVLGAAFWRAYRSAWRELEVLTYAFVAHAALLIAAVAFHNNYLLWILPVSALLMVAVARELVVIE